MALPSSVSLAISLAAANKDMGSMRSSAAFALFDAERSADQGRHEDAHRWALKSLSYSVGVFSPIYLAAQGGAQ